MAGGMEEAHLHAVEGSAAAADDAVAIGTSTAWL